jgi:hypothetical protein
MRRVLIVALAPLVACAADVDTERAALVDGTAEAIGVLRFLNGPAADVRTLDVDAALDARAARNIVAHVRGADGTLGTADDDLLDSIVELDAIPYVGPATLDRLVAYVDAIGGVPRHTVEGILLTDAEADAVLAAARGATLAELDDDAGLDARAARNIVAARPIADLDALAAVPYVGASAIERLRRWAPGWRAPVAAACHPGVLQGMRDCVERQIVESMVGLTDAVAACADAEAFGPIFDDLCAATPAPPFCAGDFETFWFTEVPPCTARLEAELAPLCRVTSDCGGAPLRCQGIPHDGSSSLGVCADTRPRPGEGAPCDAAAACGSDLVCAGAALWDRGICVADWMAGTFTVDLPALVPASAGAVVTSAAVVRGLASVPIDIEVDVDLAAVDPRRLRLELTDPNGDVGVLWNGDGSVLPGRLIPRGGISGDDTVNGAWTLTVTTLGTGTAGTLATWQLHLTSRWD